MMLAPSTPAVVSSPPRISSVMIPMISASVIGRPSISAWSTSSTTSSRRGPLRRRPRNSTIQSLSAAQCLAVSGLPGFAAVCAWWLTSRASSGGAASTSSKNASPGNGCANAAWKSHSPASTKSSINRVTSSRVRASYAATAALVNHTLMSRLYSRCSGGSMWTGIAFTVIPAGLIPTPPPNSELQVSQFCAAASTSS